MLLNADSLPLCEIHCYFLKKTLWLIECGSVVRVLNLHAVYTRFKSYFTYQELDFSLHVAGPPPPAFIIGKLDSSFDSGCITMLF